MLVVVVDCHSLAEGSHMPFDQALAQEKSRTRRFLAWCRAQLLLALFGALIFFQIMTWLEIKNIARHNWSGCGREDPCHVMIDNEDLARRIGEEVAKQFATPFPLRN